MASDESDPEIIFLENYLQKFDTFTVRLSVIIVGLLLLVSLTLTMLGLFFLIESWEVLLNGIGFNINFFPLVWTGDVTTLVVSALGSFAIGYAVLDLAKNILREEIAEEKKASVQTRARDFITRILSVVIVALAVGTFVNEARFSAASPEILWQIAAVAVSIAFLLAGWGIYIKLSRH